LHYVEGISTRDVLSVSGGRHEVAAGRRRRNSRERVRKRIPHASEAARMAGVMREAQQLGMPTTATMMFGSIETHEERIEHMHVLRELQDETGGFTAFIPWYYVPFKTPLRGKESTGLEYLRVLRDLAALSRQLRAFASFVAHARVEDGPARAFLRLRRYGWNDPRGARRPRCRKHQMKPRAPIWKT